MPNTGTGLFSTTQLEVRQAASRLVEGRDGFFTGGIASYSVGVGPVVFSTDNRNEASNYFVGFYFYVYKAASSDTKRVTAYTANNTFAINNGFSVTPDNTWDYELHRIFAPEEYNEALKMAIQEVKNYYLQDINYESEGAPGALTAALAGLGAGNVNTGDHYYKVTFVTAQGETTAGTASSVVTTTAGNGQVSLTAVPTGSDNVTSRKIYRTKVGDSVTYYLLTTLSNNTATTYPDNTADASLGASPPSSDGTIISLVTAQSEYTIPTIFSHIYSVEIDLDTSDYYKVAPILWRVNKGNRKLILDLRVVNSYSGHNLRILGLQPHSVTLTDVATVTINPNFLIYRVAAHMCLEKSVGDQSGTWFQKFTFFYNLAQEAKQTLKVAMPNNTKKVSY